MRVLGIVGNNLRNLERTGQLSRFADAYWSSYATRFDRIYIFSELPRRPVPSHGSKCIVVSPKWAIPMPIYQFLLPFLHKELRNCQLIRVMHMTGTVPALIAKWLWGIPIVATYGYEYLKLLWLSPRSRILLWVKFLYTSVVVWLGTSCSHRIIATAPQIANRLRGEGKQDKVVYIPNGVDTDLFNLNGGVDKPISLLRCVFVGRLEREKNLSPLLSSLTFLADLPLSMTIVGDGSLRQSLQTYAESNRLPVVFRGVLEHMRLPGILHEHHIFLLVSLSEGTPKALLEAMSCGLCCIGTDIPGTNSLISHGETGLLCDPSPESIAGAVRLLWENPALRTTLARNAREHVCRDFDLSTLLARETELLYSLG